MSEGAIPSRYRVVIASASGHGRQEVLEAICRAHGAEESQEQRVGDLPVCTGLFDAFNEKGDPRELELCCLAESGPYAVGQDLLIARADAVIFVFDVRHQQLEAGWMMLQRVAESAQRGGHDLRARPLVLQYHRCDEHPGFQPSQMDAWLGLPPGEEVARVVTSSSRPGGDGAVFEALWRQSGAGRLD